LICGSAEGIDPIRQPARGDAGQGMSRTALRGLARRLISSASDPIVSYRLLRDVLGRAASQGELERTARAARDSPWIEELVGSQQPDGSWGRFHSQDRGRKDRFPTTEYAVERALALGLDASHPSLARAAEYMAEVLAGQRTWSDPPEKNDRWRTGVQVITAGTLASINPQHPALREVRSLWRELAARTFAGGTYDAAAEAEAHRELTGASVKNSYLVLDNRYSLQLLGRAGDDAMPVELERALLRWLCEKDDGLGYLRVPLLEDLRTFNPNELDRWLRSWELLSGFRCWREFAETAMQDLWQSRGEDGLWDLGSRPALSPYYPLSRDWRTPARRRADQSTRILALLARYCSA